MIKIFTVSKPNMTIGRYHFVNGRIVTDNEETQADLEQLATKNPSYGIEFREISEDDLNSLSTGSDRGNNVTVGTLTYKNPGDKAGAGIDPDLAMMANQIANLAQVQAVETKPFAK